MAEKEKPVAWMRRWAFDREEPKKERQKNGRMAWSPKFKLLPVTRNKCLDDDVPCFASEHPYDKYDRLYREREQQRDELLIVADGIRARQQLRGFLVPQDAADLLAAIAKVKEHYADSVMGRSVYYLPEDV